MADKVMTTYRCHQAGCKISETGRCMEGVEPLTDCPHIDTTKYQQIPAPSGELANNDPPQEGNTNLVIERAGEEDNPLPFDPEKDISLFSGEALDFVAAANLAKKKKVRLIAFIGLTDAGKTSLFSSMYDRFLYGEFAGFSFAGTDTAIGFEKRCHHTRLASQEVDPHTPHTSLSGTVAFLHLCVKQIGNEAGNVNLLFTDRSGEEFKNAIDNTSLVSELIELQRADRVVLLIDGKRFADIQDRHAVISDALKMLRVLVDNGVLDHNDKLDIVLSKFDIVETSDRRKAIETDFSRLKNDINIQFLDSIGSIDYWKVAAIPKHEGSKLDIAFGLEELFEKWAKVETPTPNIRIFDEGSVPAYATQFDLFGARYFALQEEQ